LQIRQKYRCDCKAFYVSGWLCSHILATLKIRDNFNLAVLVKSIPARKPPGRPRKKLRTRQSDALNTGQYTIPKLLTKLAAKPGFPTKWKVLVPLEVEDGEEVYKKHFEGIVQPWFEKEGKYFWEIELTDEDFSVEAFDIQELAEVLNFTARSGYQFV